MISTTITRPKQQVYIRVVLMGPSLQQNGGMAEVQKLIYRSPIESLQVQHICTHDEGSISHRGFVFGKALGSFATTLMSGKADIVHLHMSERGSVVRTIFLVLFCLIFRRPVLIHTHGAEFAPFFLGLPKLLQRIISFTFRKCSGFIVLSQSWRDFYLYQMNLNKDRVFTLPNSVVLPEQIPVRDPSRSIQLSCCGRIGERKGTFDLIRSLTFLPEHLKASVTLMLAGDGDIQQAKKLVSNLGLSNNVRFLGWIDSKQRDQLLASSDIFILPSYNEGLPLAILEAMAWGLPVITTPVGGIPEVVIHGGNGLLVQPGNIKQLSESINYLIEDISLRHKMGKQSRKTAKMFDANHYNQKIFDIYNLVLQNR